MNRTYNKNKWLNSLCFLQKKKYLEYRKQQSEDISNNKNVVSPNVYFTKQTVQNACGTVGIIHSLANNRQVLNIDLERAFGKYLRATETMTPEQSAEYLKQDEEISCAHSESANEGQTEVRQLNLNFIKSFFYFNFQFIGAAG
jgi:ubiquitin carboxyl-terminal hydrolase L3